MMVDGAPAAYPGGKTACKAVLVPGQFFTTFERSGGSGSAAGSKPGGSVNDANRGAIGAGLASGYEDQARDERL